MGGEMEVSVLDRAEDAAFLEMDRRGLLKNVDDDLHDEIKEAVALAVISAMREPDSKMIDAADSLDPDDLARDEYRCYQISFNDGAMTRIWQTMIDEAIK